MYAIIFKEGADTYQIVDVYYKGRWEFNKSSLIGYLLYVGEIAKYDYIDNEIIVPAIMQKAEQYNIHNVEEIISFIETENLPIFVNFDPYYMIRSLETHDLGIITPPTPIIETTQFCNYKCRWCYIPERDIQTNKYDLEVFESKVVTPLIKKFGLLEWCLTGGEPSLEKERTIRFAQIIKAKTNQILGRDPVSIYMLTNGYDLEHNIEDFFENGINAYQVALSSPVKEREIDLRQPPAGIDSYEHAVNGIKAAKKLGATTEINMIIQPRTSAFSSNIDDIAKMFELAKELNVDMLRVIPAVPSGQALKNNIFFSQVDYNFIKNIVANQRKTYEKYYIVECPLDQEIEPDREVYCRAGTLWLYINFKGEIFPCNNMQCNELRSEYTIKNITADFIWLNDTHLKSMRNYNINTLSTECVDCEYRVECVGECRALSWIRYNQVDLSVKPDNCYKSKVLQRNW